MSFVGMFVFNETSGEINTEEDKFTVKQRIDGFILQLCQCLRTSVVRTGKNLEGKGARTLLDLSQEGRFQITLL